MVIKAKIGGFVSRHEMWVGAGVVEIDANRETRPVFGVDPPDVCADVTLPRRVRARSTCSSFSMIQRGLFSEGSIGPLAASGGTHAMG